MTITAAERTAGLFADPTTIPLRLTDLTTRMKQIGQAYAFPAAGDIDWTPLEPVFSSGLINHLGDPEIDGLYPRHVKSLERDVITLLSALFRVPAGDGWGYVTSGATEGILWGIWTARRLHPNGIVYHSAAAHPAVRRAVDITFSDNIVVRADPTGEMDYADFAAQIDMHRDRPVIVVATAGTTWTEAVDDVRTIHVVLDRHEVPADRRFVLVDAALSGIPLALLDPDNRPGFDLADGADVVVVSGHKFLGTPMPCGVLIARRRLLQAAAAVSYIGVQHPTVTFSRNGHGVVAQWYALNYLGLAGLISRADASRDRARHLHDRLAAAGVPVRRNRLAMTVTFAAPAEPVRERYGLQLHDDVTSHLVCAPGSTHTDLDSFVSFAWPAAADDSGADGTTEPGNGAAVTPASNARRTGGRFRSRTQVPGAERAN